MCPEKTCLGDSSGGVRGVSAGNFRGGRKPFPKPSAFESEIHPSHKTPFCTLGISPCRGQIHAGMNLYSPKELDCIYPCRQRAGAWMVLLLTATFQGKCAASSEELHRTTSLCGCQKAAAADCPDTGISWRPAVR